MKGRCQTLRWIDFYPLYNKPPMPKGDHLAEFELFVMLAVARLGDDNG
jgi:hypothetical protein